MDSFYHDRVRRGAGADRGDGLLPAHAHAGGIASAAAEGDGRPGGTTNPEELAAGYAACFQRALGVVGRRRGVDTAASTVEADVTIGTIAMVATASPSRCGCLFLVSMKQPLSEWLSRHTRSARTQMPPAATSR